jgi:predicted nucleotidyltransferase
MSKQRDALAHLISRCVDAHPDCGIRLQGSVARGEERADSDVDLTVVVPSAGLIRENELLFADNHWRMRRIIDPFTQVSIDVNWIGVSELLDSVEAHGASAWYMFFKGNTLRDPRGVVELSAETISSWFLGHPRVLDAWNRQQVAVENFKKDPNLPLQFPTQPEFLRHLETSTKTRD